MVTADLAVGADELAKHGAAALSPASCRTATYRTRHRAQPEIMGALRHEQAHRPVALELESQRAAELQGGREQHRGGHRLPEQLA